MYHQILFLMVISSRKVMWPHFLIFLSLRLSSEVAHTLPSPQDSKTSVPLATWETNFDTLCPLKEVQDESHLFAWQEIPQRTQGCAVPFNGPQGHGQHPEEVHIVHITEVDSLIETLSNQKGVVVSITVWLEAASCQNKVSLGSSTAASEQPKASFKNNTDFIKAEVKAAVKKPNAQVTPKLNDMVPQNFVAQVAEVEGPIRTTTYPLGPASNRPLVLLLTSDQPVIWHIKSGACWTQSLVSKIQAVVERGSSVDSKLPVEVVQKIWIKKINRKTIQRYARRTYHGVASFTQIRGANSVRIGIGPDGPMDRKSVRPISWHNRNKLNFCNFSSREESEIVSAALSVPLMAEACVLGNTNSTKSFVIDVQYPPDNGFDVTGNLKHESDLAANGSLNILPQVMVFLSENNYSSYHGSKETENISKNFTVVLRSEKHIQWILSSSVEESYVYVIINDGDAIDCITSCGKNLELISLPLQDSRSDLLHTIFDKFGNPLHYFTIKHATGLALKVDSLMNESIQGLGKFHQPEASSNNFPMPPSFRPLVNLNDTSKKRYISSMLQSDMLLTCERSMFEIVFPASALMHAGVKGLYLNDKSCYSLSNGSHFVLSSLLEKCGSDVQVKGKTSVISNTVFADLTFPNANGLISEESVPPEDNIAEHSKPAGVTIFCSSTTVLKENNSRSIFKMRDATLAAQKKGVENSSPESSSSIYQLELYHKALLSREISPLKFETAIDVNDQVFGQIWMDDAPSAKAIPNSCWISNLSHNDQKIFLLQGMCPSRKGVRLESSLTSHLPIKPQSFVFSFQISQDFSQLGQEFFVHCQIGICLTNAKLSKGKSLLCVDPQEFCKHQDPFLPRSNTASTAHQLLTRGPIVLSPVEPSFTVHPPIIPKCSEVPVFPHRSAISMDMTAVIALCSFVMGIGLTATLWLIHNKTEPKHRHRVCHTREHSLGSHSAVLGSSLSPHSACSSTNSQCAITA